MVALVLVAAGLGAGVAHAMESPPGFGRAVRELDGAQFLEDEPIWLCDDGEPNAGIGRGDLLHDFRILGFDERGRRVPKPPPPGWNAASAWSRAAIGLADLRRPRAGEFVQSLRLPPRADLHALGPWPGTPGGLAAGRYEVRRGLLFADDPSLVDTATVFARFQVLAPRKSEEAVRAALARAARLAAQDDSTRHADAARLYEAVLARYPRTSYRTLVYAGLWRVREHTAYAADPGAWLEEVFAHFHSTCFGVWALDVFMSDVPNDEARPRLRRLVGLYPDTMLSRAAARYL